MGFSKKHQGEGGGKELDGKKWVIAGITIRAPMKSISTKGKGEYEEDDGRSTTPTARESRIPERLPCPPAPRKRRPTSTCHFNGGREFFIPPDLESVFIRHVERAN
ncbi:cyclin-dependent protein kinase inhibitor SMR6 [Coffea eugenioides]|uniref:cyclin-dependent protein kinase inhibitor SMR6 n=1 Tax=Coffea eugenioides TaxID=49369 RepID=UPI000F6094FA|nr:cyclin-dependent protein kinase inhibitor SMR6 [Coffea eugenioides]